jgi:DNA-binding LacI/PurR family transcriptional regulator
MNPPSPSKTGHTARVTIHDVARHAGVSPMTVSRVTNERPRVRPDTRRRVQDSISKLGYVPNRLARSLIERRTATLGVIVTDVSNPLIALVVRRVEDLAWRAGYRVILCNTRCDSDRERGYLEDMLAFQVEGVLIARAREQSPPDLLLLSRNSIPYVLLSCSVASIAADCVAQDVACARRLIDRLKDPTSAATTPHFADREPSLRPAPPAFGSRPVSPK